MSERKIIEIKAAIEGIEQSVNRIAKGEDKVNWKQARVDAAVAAMNGILSRKNNLPFDTHEKEVCEEVARISVALADALIAELKKKGE